MASTSTPSPEKFVSIGRVAVSIWLTLVFAWIVAWIFCAVRGNSTLRTLLAAVPLYIPSIVLHFYLADIAALDSYWASATTLRLLCIASLLCAVLATLDTMGLWALAAHWQHATLRWYRGKGRNLGSSWIKDAQQDFPDCDQDADAAWGEFSRKHCGPPPSERRTFLTAEN